MKVQGMEMQDWYDILDTVREMGVMNMFGAPRWLQDEYNLTKAEANEVFWSWAHQFDPEKEK